MPRRAAYPTPRTSPSARALLAAPLLFLAACTTVPADYAASLRQDDPRWRSPECTRMRAQAATYESGRKPPMGWGTGVLLGPYGLGLAVASRDHQEKQRRRFAADLHRACSGQPVPRALNVDPDRPDTPGTMMR